MLPNPIPYSESESVLLRQHFFLLVSCFLIAFSSLSIFSHNCAKDCFVGLDFLAPFLVAWKLDFSFPFFSYLQQSCVLCVVYAPPCFLQRSQCLLLGSSFLWNFVSRLCTKSLVSFLIFCRSFLSGLCVGSFLGTYALNSLKALK